MNFQHWMVPFSFSKNLDGSTEVNKTFCRALCQDVFGITGQAKLAPICTSSRVTLHCEFTQYTHALCIIMEYFHVQPKNKDIEAQRTIVRVYTMRRKSIYFEKDLDSTELVITSSSAAAFKTKYI